MYTHTHTSGTIIIRSACAFSIFLEIQLLILFERYVATSKGSGYLRLVMTTCHVIS